MGVWCAQFCHFLQISQLISKKQSVMLSLRSSMEDVAQLAELLVVVQAVAGSSPVFLPIFFYTDDSHLFELSKSHHKAFNS